MQSRIINKRSVTNFLRDLEDAEQISHVEAQSIYTSVSLYLHQLGRNGTLLLDESFTHHDAINKLEEVRGLSAMSGHANRFRIYMQALDDGFVTGSVPVSDLQNGHLPAGEKFVPTVAAKAAVKPRSAAAGKGKAKKPSSDRKVAERPSIDLPFPNDESVTGSDIERFIEKLSAEEAFSYPYLRSMRTGLRLVLGPEYADKRILECDLNPSVDPTNTHLSAVTQTSYKGSSIRAIGLYAKRYEGAFLEGLQAKGIDVASIPDIPSKTNVLTVDL